MLYKIEANDVENSKRMKLYAPADFDLQESHIEDFLKSRLYEVVQEERLLLIGQERSWQEEADLLALDKDGVLYIFELKRWESNQENLLQVMRYGQIFGRYSYENLENLSKQQKKIKSEDSLQKVHHHYFESDRDKELPKSEFNAEQVFVLVTHGLDGDTISAVEYWRKKGVRIECAPYQIYDIGGEPYIQFHTYSPDHEFVAEHNTHDTIVNTNTTHMPEVWKSMLNECKASAYYGKKHSVTGIQKRDRVYLYHNRVGVIAKGIATSSYKKTDFDGDHEAEFYVPLDFSNGWCLSENDWDKAPKAWQINQALETGHRFRQTVFSVSKDMAKAIDDIYAENNESA